jgi:lipopolysaccharide export LptBFGC system permease protein LptF
MHFDLRLPIGLMFSVYGALLLIFGTMTAGDEIYAKHSLGMNINLVWGAVLLVFGLCMLVLGWRGAKRP